MWLSRFFVLPLWRTLLVALFGVLVAIGYCYWERAKRGHERSVEVERLLHEVDETLELARQRGVIPD
jgi:hypothetical protein